MRKLLVVGVLLLPLTPLAAQSKIQIIAGLSSAKVTASESGVSASVGSRTGFGAGIGIVNSIGKSLEFAPEVLYVQKGFDQSADGDEEIGKLAYVEVPILFRASFGDGGVHPFVTAGPEIAIKVSCSFEDTFDGTTTTSDCSSDQGGINSFDFGGIVGAGLQMRKIAIAARYDIGFSNIAKGATNGASLKNRSWFFLASLTL